MTLTRDRTHCGQLRVVKGAGAPGPAGCMKRSLTLSLSRSVGCRLSDPPVHCTIVYRTLPGTHEIKARGFARFSILITHGVMRSGCGYDMNRISPPFAVRDARRSRRARRAIASRFSHVCSIQITDTPYSDHTTQHACVGYRTATGEPHAPPLRTRLASANGPPSGPPSLLTGLLRASASAPAAAAVSSHARTAAPPPPRPRGGAADGTLSAGLSAFR